MICGFVVARKGEKFSKSKGNAPLSPRQLIEAHSANGLRYWAASSKLGTDSTFSADDLQNSNRFLTKLWNASRFCLMHLADYSQQKPAALHPIDQWIRARVTEVTAQTSRFLQQYEVGAARLEIDRFFWHDFCDDFLEIIKDRLYKPEIDGVSNRCSAQYALYRTLLDLLKLYAVFTPHINEEIYQAYFAEQEQELSIHGMRWEESAVPDPDLLAFGTAVQECIGQVRKYKSERNWSLRQEVDRLRLGVPEHLLPLFQSAEADLQACTRAVALSIGPAAELTVDITATADHVLDR